MNKKLLVTGAAGFVGFHLALSLKKRGDKPVVLDDFNDYYSVKLKRDRAKKLAEAGIAVFEGDICDGELLKDIVRKEKITHVVHLAAQAGVRYSIDHPDRYVHCNLVGFFSILELCRHCQLPLIYASTSSVYGKNEKQPFSVEDRCDEPVSFYAATKKSNEVMAHSYHHLYGIPMTALRFFTVYGPWGRPDMAYFSFTKAIMEGKAIPLFNHGQLRRDFTYIDDIVSGVIAAIDLEADYETFNLGNHQPVELLRFVEVIEDCLGKKANKTFLPMQDGDVYSTYADIEHSRDRLGFTPKTSIEEGISKFVEWYQSYYQSADLLTTDFSL